VNVRIVIFLICFSAYLSAAAQAPPTEPEAGPRYPEKVEGLSKAGMEATI